MRSHRELKREITAILEYVADGKHTPLSQLNLAGAINALKWMTGDFGHKSPLEKMIDADKKFKAEKDTKDKECTTAK